MSMIEHPAHYCEGRKYEPKDVIHDWGLNFNLGSAVKYLARAGRKPNESKAKDLKKAITYIQFELDADKAAREALKEENPTAFWCSYILPAGDDTAFCFECSECGHVIVSREDNPPEKCPRCKRTMKVWGR